MKPLLLPCRNNRLRISSSSSRKLKPVRSFRPLHPCLRLKSNFRLHHRHPIWLSKMQLRRHRLLL
jgi:hypothetical protein